MFLLFLFWNTIVFGQFGRNKSDILKVKIVKDSAQLIDIKLLNFNDLNGFPSLNCTFSDGFYEFPKNRFLAISNEELYYVIDSNSRIIIGKSDSIISFSHDIQYKDSLFDVACSQSYRGQMNIYYQSVREGYTYLYDYEGSPVTSVPYLGEIYEGSYNIEANSSYWVTVNCLCDSFKMGLIDSSGREIAAQRLITERFIGPFNYNFNNLWRFRNIKSNLTNVVDVYTGDTVLRYSPDNSYSHEYGIFVYQIKGKYGVFHPLLGTIVKPKYDKIEQTENTNDTYLLTKGRRHKVWKVKEEIKKKYSDTYTIKE